MAYDTVSDGEILRSLAEMRVRFPEAGRFLQDARRGRLSLRDAVYFSLLASEEKRRREKEKLVFVEA